jgi:hypothetical protein
MVLPQGRRPEVVNLVIAQANAPVVPPARAPAARFGINFGVARVGVAARTPQVPNVIAEQPPGLPPFTPLEEAFTEIGFSIEAARMLESLNNQNITLLYVPSFPTHITRYGASGLNV